MDRDAQRQLERSLVSSLFDCAGWMPERIEEVVQMVNEKDMTDQLSATIYQTMIDLHESGSRYSSVEVSQRLQGSVKFLDIVEVERIRADRINTLNLAEKVRENAERCRLIETGHRIMELGKNSQYSPQALYDEAQTIMSLAEPTKIAGTGAVRVTDLLLSYMDELQAVAKSYRESGGTLLTGIDTKKVQLNAYTNGLQRKDLIILAAPPSVGKTQFLIDLLLSITEEADTYGYLASAEMAKDKPLIDRMVANRAMVEGERLKSGNLTEEEWGRVNSGIGAISQSLYVDDTNGMTLLHIKREARRIRKQIGKDAKFLIAVDYIQMLPSPPGMNNRHEAVGFITKELKNLAKELNATVIAISSLSRGVSQRENKRPMMSDLRDSGEIEFHADLIWFLYRSSYYDHQAANPNETELIIDKHRNGPCGTILLNFTRKWGKFFDILPS